MAHRRSATWLLSLAAILLASGLWGQSPPAGAPSTKAAGGDVETVQKLINLRREYQKTLEQLHAYYRQIQDKEREQWAKEELISLHRIPKHAFILDLDVPPPLLNGHQNVPEANKLFTWAMQYKDKGFGTEYTDNQRRAEVLFQEILTKYPHSDKIAGVAFMLGDIYESKAYRQYYRAVEYYHRCYQWNPKTTHEARLRAARLYDQKLNNRSKAIELYREITTHETDPRHIAEAQKRIAELSAPR